MSITPEQKVSITTEQMANNAEAFASREVDRLPENSSRELVKACLRVAYIQGGMDFLQELKRQLSEG